MSATMILLNLAGFRYRARLRRQSEAVLSPFRSCLSEAKQNDRSAGRDVHLLDLQRQRREAPTHIGVTCC